MRGGHGADGRSFPERQSLFIRRPRDPTRLYHGHGERTSTRTQPVTVITRKKQKSAEIGKTWEIVARARPPPKNV